MKDLYLKLKFCHQKHLKALLNFISSLIRVYGVINSSGFDKGPGKPRLVDTEHLYAFLKHLQEELITYWLQLTVFPLYDHLN